MTRATILSDPRIGTVSQKVIEAAKDTLGEKLEKIILFGSYARGDYDADSDIDFCVLAKVPNEEVPVWDRGIYERLPGIDLEHDMIVSVHVTGSEIFHQYANDLPYYMNIIREGVELYA